jgi:hypothetical protein
MGKVLLLWELDRTRVPVEPKERLTAWTMMMNMVRNDLKSGGLKEWGMFIRTIREVQGLLNPLSEPDRGSYKGSITSLKKGHGAGAGPVASPLIRRGSG